MTDSTATTVVYTDFTPPTTFPGTFQVGIPNAVTSKPPHVEYALYEDSATWSAWSEWATQNAYETKNKDSYSARAIEIKGTWDTMSEGDKSFMCIIDKSTSNNRGGLCMEANITGSGATLVFSTKTYSIKQVDVAAVLPDGVSP